MHARIPFYYIYIENIFIMRYDFECYTFNMYKLRVFVGYLLFNMPL